eukprot:4698457-Pleurochrysis_carterae.AAC.1
MLSLFLAFAPGLTMARTLTNALTLSLALAFVLAFTLALFLFLFLALALFPVSRPRSLRACVLALLSLHPCPWP